MFLRLSIVYYTYVKVCKTSNSVFNTIGRSFTLFRLADCEFVMCARCVYIGSMIFI